MTIQTQILNSGQEDAADGVFQFLLSDDKEYAISGPGGTGKTFLMRHIMSTVLPLYENACALLGRDPISFELALTATTNKAAEVLQTSTGFPAQTIHSFMNLKVRDDYKTGETKIERTKSWKVHERTVLFIDEASMIDSKLLKFIHEGTDKTCKIIYVGDHCQLAPVFEKISPIYLQPKNFSELTQPMRNSGQPALMALCQQLRDTVETGVFFPITEVPGVIDYLDDSEAQAFIDQTFKSETTDHRILAYTNQRVQEYNGYIRDLRGYPDRVTQGEILINNVGIQIGEKMMRVEEEYVVLEADPIADAGIEYLPQDGALEFYKIKIAPLANPMNAFTVRIPLYPDHLKDLQRFYARQKDWESYYRLKNGFPDLRPRDASTVYKAQGSTYRSVLIDLTNIGTCKQADQVARMLYVAVSRPTDRIFLYGALPPRFCGGA